MRLINTTTLGLEEFEGSNIPSYAILSHRWQEEEVTFKDMTSGSASDKKGYHKISKLCELARAGHIRYAWCDTCCIDKSSSAELSEAINSVFGWYAKSRLCYAYLFDVTVVTPRMEYHLFIPDLSHWEVFNRKCVQDIAMSQ